MTQLRREFEPITLPPLPHRPLVSVLIPNYNYAHYLGIAIESVLGQTYENFEVIVCDDGSKDNSREVVQGYVKKDPRVQLVLQENRGVTSAVNAAYENCKGEVIALLDADDAFKPSKLESVLESFRENPRSGLCVNRMLYVSAAGQPIGEPPRPLNPEYGWLGAAKLKQGGDAEFPAASGISLRREVARELFPIPLAVTRAQDYYLSHTALFFTEVSLATRVLTEYRVHGANKSGQRPPRRRSHSIEIGAGPLETWAGNTEQILPLQKAFLARFYGPDVAEALRIEDHRRYWDYLLTIRALRGRRAGAIRSFTVQEMAEHVPSRFESRIWRVILLLPDPLAKRAFSFWRSSSPLKRAMGAVARPVFQRLTSR